MPILAKFGDGQALLNISKSFYDYNPQSIQAIGIRAQVLKVVTSVESACKLQEKLLENTPWQQDIVENYLECLKLGNRDKNYRNQLTLVKKYVNFFPAINDTPVTLESMLARAVGARVEFELGNFDLARSLKLEIEKQMQNFDINNPGRDFSKIISILDYQSKPRIGPSSRYLGVADPKSMSDPSELMEHHCPTYFHSVSPASTFSTS